MKKYFGWIIAGGVLLVLAAIVVGTPLFVTRRPFPDTSGVQTVSGISAPVEIIRDESGIPHIYAETTDDMYFAQGFAHAQDRFWQMEFSRRLGAGRLSEYFGESTLSIDQFMRTMGFFDIAQREYESLPESNRTALEAYAAGVNAYTQDRAPGALGLEFTLLRLQGVDVEIEPWKPVNSLTWLKIMAYDLGGNLQEELNHVDLVARVGLEKAMEFYPEYRLDDMPVIVPDEELEGFLGDALLSAGASGSAAEPERAHTGAAAPKPAQKPELGRFTSATAMQSLTEELIGGETVFEPLAFGRGGSVGSNSWVIGGSRTQSGMPLLAADLHLGVQMPSIWYEVVLHAGTDTASGRRPFDAAGFSFAGVPGVILGHNGDIAWGLTNVNPDVQDLYIERINPENPHQYLVNGEWRDMEVGVEEIDVHGRPEPFRFTVRTTRNGPIITDAEGPQDERSGFGVDTPSTPPEGATLTELSLRWTAFRVNRTFRAVFEWNRARDFAEFRDAAKYFDIPSQNLVFADTRGNIAYQTPGLIPVRRNGDGTFPVPGWVDDYQWEGFIPFEELPYTFNPEQDYVVTANNAVTSDRYEHLITTDFNHGYRARRIVDMVEAGGDRIAGDDVARQQGDSLNLSAMEIVPFVLDVAPADVEIAGLTVPAEDIRAAQEVLDGWDGYMSEDSSAAALYALFYVRLIEETLRDEIPAKLWKRSRLLSGTSRIHTFFHNILSDPENSWWDDVTTPDVREDRDEVLRRALAGAMVTGRDLMGNRLSRWEWGGLHTITFRNQTFGESGIGLIESLFNRGPYPVRSGLDQVFSADFDLADPFETVNHTSMRQIIDLAELSESRLVHTTGQSGHPYHEHYTDFIEKWRTLEFHEHYWKREELLESDFDLLRLDPAAKE
ncbi:MAG: penicillin acylase family protein [bacterium]